MEAPTFEAIVDEHWSSIRRWLAHVGIRSRDMDDVAQEVLLAVAERLPAFNPTVALRPEGAVRGWILRICVRQAASHRRTLFRRAEDLQDYETLDGLHCGWESVEDCLMAHQERAALEKALDALPPPQRSVIVEHQLLGIPMEEVARTHGISSNTAWNRLRLARADVRASLTRCHTSEGSVSSSLRQAPVRNRHQSSPASTPRYTTSQTTAPISPPPK